MTRATVGSLFALGAGKGAVLEFYGGRLASVTAAAAKAVMGVRRARKLPARGAGGVFSPGPAGRSRPC